MSSATAQDQLSEFGDFVVHYNALSTDQLPPDVARSYGIVRSASRVLLNVVIIRKKEGTTGEPATGKVVARVSNLTGQLKNMSIRKVDEENAIYYIGEVRVADGEVLVFDIDVTPDGMTEPHNVRFQRQFFVN